MDIRIEAPPVDAPRRGKNKSYRKLFAAVREAKGDWVAVDADEIAGKNSCLKRITLNAASQWHKVKIEIAITNEKVYVRLIARETPNA